MALVGSYLERHTARPSSAFDCELCHDSIQGEYVQHKFVHSGPKGGRYSNSYRYHPDCYDPPRPSPPVAPLVAARPGSLGPALLIGVAVVGIGIAGYMLYAWWKNRPPRPTA